MSIIVIIIKLSKTLDQLDDIDIIEKWDKPSKWVSPVVCVPKGNDDIRLCVDIDKDATNFCKSCYGCLPCKPEPMTRTELPTAPWQHLAANLLGPLPSEDYIFVVVDHYS